MIGTDEMFLISRFFVFFTHVAAHKTFWQITDMHVHTRYDPVYGSTEHWCERPNGSVVPVTNIGKYGNFACDPPYVLIEEAVKGMKEIDPNPDFIVWNGDSSAHFPKEETPSFRYVFNVEKRLINTIRKYFPDTEVAPVLGNHDSSPPDFFPENPEFYRKYFKESNWSAIITDRGEQSQFMRCGFFKRDIKGKTFLLLNTNIYYHSNNTGYDPCGQLKWLSTELDSAESNSVVVAAHVPPGYFERNNYGPFMETNNGDSHYNDLYFKIIADHSDKIYAQFYGHTHADSFRLFSRGKAEDAVAVAFIAPSVSPRVDWETGTFPSIRLYRYDDDTLLDYDQYFFNITSDGKWKLAYNFRQTYQTKDLSLESMKMVFANISTQPKMFQTYYSLNTVLHEETACNATCVLLHLCGISKITVASMEECIRNKIYYISMNDKSLEKAVVVTVTLLLPITALIIWAFFYCRRGKVRKSCLYSSYETVPLSRDFE